MVSTSVRNRADRCPGIVRPWPADDGLLARIRLVGGRIRSAQLLALGGLARRYGDGDLHLTRRANLQMRALPAADDGSLAAEVVEAIEMAGLLPSRSHDRARNVMVSPLSGLRGGRADVRPVAEELDRLIWSDPELAALPGRFLFVMDDGRGDLLDAPVDLGLVALDFDRAQLRIGRERWGETVALSDAAERLVGLARRFVLRRGAGPGAPWHVDELREPLTEERPRDPLTLATSPPLPYGAGHVAAQNGTLDAALAADLAARGSDLIVTPWRGVLIPEEVRRA